jgi:hypothetical protein
MTELQKIVCYEKIIGNIDWMETLKHGKIGRQILIPEKLGGVSQRRKFAKVLLTILKPFPVCWELLTKFFTPSSRSTWQGG